MNKDHLYTWFAAIRWVQGEGWIPPHAPYYFPDQKNYVVLFDFDSMEEPRLSAWLAQCAAAVAPQGYFCLGFTPNKTFTMPPGFKLVEDSRLGTRQFQAWQKTEADPKRLALPDIIIFRDGHAHGDALQASAVAAWYARKYPDKAVALMVRPNAVETVGNTPNVGIMKIEGCITNNEIPAFVEFWTLRCGLLVNLDWSVEGNLLKYGGMRDYYWTHEQRKACCDGNYNTNVQRVSGMDEPLRIQYYPSSDDLAAAEALKPKNPYIAIVMRGSAVHKWYPFIGDLLILLLAKLPHDIILLGDPSSAQLGEQALERAAWGHGSMERIHNLIGRTKIGGSIMIAKDAACVVGPETGVLLALCHEDTPKVMVISQSSYGNFNDFINCNMISGNVPCAPCHRHHNDFSYCFQDQKTGASICQAAISPAALAATVEHAMTMRAAPASRQCSAPASAGEPEPHSHAEAEPAQTTNHEPCDTGQHPVPEGTIAADSPAP